MRLSDFVVTRVVEVCVHALDLRYALGLPPAATAEGLRVTTAILGTLLGSEKRPPGMDDVRFVVVGTGREPLTDDERWSLGALSERLPLIS